MKTRIASILLLTVGSAHAATPINGWYSSLFGGYADLPNHLNITTHGNHLNHSEFKTGYDAGGSFGFKSTPMRYEGEFTYINGEPEHFKINGVRQTGVDGYSDTYLGMANVYYDFPALIKNLEPFLGLGLGYAYIDGQFKSTGPNGIYRYKGNDSAFAYQGIAGITFNFSEYCALNIAYRYVATTEVDAFGKAFQAQLANVGVTYRFDIDQYK